jgi:hypothetical protein
MRYRIHVLVFTFFLSISSVKSQIIINSDSAKIHPKVIANILVLGTKRTHDEVVFRELTFTNGDTVTNVNFEIQRSRSNLINTLLFNFVDIKETKIDSTFSDIIIVVKERWYIWPIPVFNFAEPNFNTWWLNKSFARTNYGGILLWRNFRGWNEELGAKAQFGYSKEFIVLYRVPYLTNKYRLGMQITANYTQQEEITVATQDNKRVFYRSGTGKSRTEFGGKLTFFYRKKLYVTHTLDLRYQNLQITDSLTRFTNDYFYKNQPHMEFPGLSYAFRFDKRDNKGYPLNGVLLQAEFYKYGASLFDDKNLNVAYVSGYIKNYFRLYYKWYFATQIRYKYTLTKNLPYYFQQGLGYENFVRGYEYYIVDGQHFGLFKSNLKYNVIKPKTYAIDALKSTNFYMFHYAAYINLFFDAGYVSDKYYAEKNTLANQLIYSAGIGIDLVTFYDKVIRFEYTLNKQMQHGFFIHFVQPI